MMDSTPSRLVPLAILLVAIAGGLGSIEAQELEPRRWGHLPTNSHFAGVGYAYTKGDILFDPVLLIEDVELNLHTGLFKYIYTFELFDKLARVDFTQGYQNGRWSGRLDGEPATVTRSGWSDTVLRFSMNLVGSPPLEGQAFADYRKSVADRETIIGAGVAVHLPTGYYLEDKLLNLGTNRFTIRPQLGMVHSVGKLSLEVTGGAWFYTDNDAFWNGNTLENDPLLSLQGHLVYTFQPGLWVSTGLGWARGGRSTLNGIKKDDRRTNVVWGVSAGYAFTPKVGIKAGYIGYQTRESVGADLDNAVVALSILW